MVKLSTPALVSLLAASVAAADLRAAYRGAHRNLHRRGETHSVVSYESTYPVSKPPAQTGYPTGQPPKDTSEDTTCTEESTQPIPESKPTKSYPESAPPAETTHKTYPTATYESKTYETSTTPAESTYESTTCTEESTSESKTYESKTYESKTYESKTYESKTYESKTYQSKTYESKTYESKTYESKTYSTSVPASETYSTSVPASETAYPTKSYESSPPSESTYESSQSYPESTPQGETSTYWQTEYSTHYQTLSGGSPYPTKPAPEECGTVTITVTAGQEHPTYSAKPAPEKPTYSAKPQPAPEHSSYSQAPAKPHTTAKPKPENNVGKRGIAYATIPTLNVGSATGIHWAHNWAAAPTGLPKGVDYVPMCKDESMESEFQQYAKEATHLMSFNEVDMTQGGGGTAKTPQQAAAAYKQIMMPYAGTHKLGAPSVTSHDSESDHLNGVSAASGLAYLKQFAQACEGCQVDFACLHWYGGGEDAHTQAQLFKTYVTKAVATVQQLWPGCKVWIDEFSAAPTIDKDGSGVNKQFMEYVLPWLDAQSDIERYSYFAATPGLMANADGSLTEIGQTYASY